ncbi:beta-lactamase-like protein [Paraphysoderma sedebokerense]|nr:beta-lactamase-like protein [Paraphysoderma sedebokerense]
MSVDIMKFKPSPSLEHLELNNKNCKTYLLWCPVTHQCALFDPLRENIPLYLSVIGYKGLSLQYVIDSHSHADHFTAGFELKRLTGAKIMMHELAPAPKVDVHVKDGDVIEVGRSKFMVLYTPGHTPDSISLYTGRAVFTGDVLFIGGSGRTDFAGGDAGTSYDSIQTKLFTLPEDTLVLPSHDYRYNTVSTIGKEKQTNPRLAGKSRDEYIHIMNNLGLETGPFALAKRCFSFKPLPEKIMEALQINVSAIHDNEIELPTYTQISSTMQIDPLVVHALVANPPSNSNDQPLMIDVREQEEFEKLPPLPGAIHIPLRELSKRIKELEDKNKKQVITLCRAGVRSSTAASLLIAMGFENVKNMKGGMVSYWKQFPKASM